MLQEANKRIIFLTGPPGIGKTTLVKKVCKGLAERNIPLCGFYTEELREGQRRIGFDIVTFTGMRGVLARIKDAADPNSCRYQVGQYRVDKISFESLALPVFNTQDCNSVLVLDEIGRMELFSDKFKHKVREAVDTPNRVILATIPIAKGRPLSFVEELRCHQNAKLFTIFIYLVQPSEATVCGWENGHLAACAPGGMMLILQFLGGTGDWPCCVSQLVRFQKHCAT